jgi:hypothetical protein
MATFAADCPTSEIGTQAAIPELVVCRTPKAPIFAGTRQFELGGAEEPLTAHQSVIVNTTAIP